ncbi:IQ domain-containing protein C [Hemicordylus capensis]|uniref:IQ domain-containing protein C n=1 Tax=Hemicordylus capensis TaxID=884348 RepID=UPI002303D924|nr:IQ domain-containing protein C [Hemicordylus capensis]
MEAEARLLLQLPRRVAQLQACVRGYLVRKRFQSLKEEYESIVREIEGTPDRLQWKRCSIPRPVFLPKKPVRVKELRGPETGSNESHARKKAEKCCQTESPSQKEHDGVGQLPSLLPAEVVAEAEASDLRPNPEDFVEKLSGDVLNLCEEVKDCRSVSSEWSSSVLETESPRWSQELPFQRRPEMPQALPDLQRHRRHLAMELLWLQQAIASRKNYLVLKQRLANPE